jgi:hypothetical protein
MNVTAVTKSPSLKKPGGVDKAYYVDSLGGSEILSESLLPEQIMFLCILLLHKKRRI